MTTRYFALVMGIAFLLVGVMGFIPAFVTEPTGMHHVTVHAYHGMLLGLFPVNLWHNVVHLLFGVLGVAAFMSFWWARMYARMVAVIYALLAVLGLIPATETTFGWIPIHGHDVWLHATIALVAAIFGWALIERGRTTDTSDTTTPHTPHFA